MVFSRKTKWRSVELKRCSAHKKTPFRFVETASCQSNIIQSINLLLARLLFCYVFQGSAFGVKQQSRRTIHYAGGLPEL